MKILIACEYSGRVREAFKACGHDTTSCDILPTSIAGQHYQGDIFDIIDNGFDMMIAFPPCTHLAVSGARWFEEKRKDGRQQQGIDFFLKLANANIEKICLENPVSIMSTEWRKPDQIIQPWQFGHETTKATCLWLKGLPLLEPTNIVSKGKRVFYKSGNSSPEWHDKTWGLSPEERAKARSKTYMGIAKAMAEQWGTTSFLNNTQEKDGN